MKIGFKQCIFKLQHLTHVSMAVWQLLPHSHTNICKFGVFQKGIIFPPIFNIFLSHFLHLSNVTVSLNYLSCAFFFAFAKLTRIFNTNL